MSNILYTNSYDPSSSDIFFFDNNIWMFLFCPIGNVNRKLQDEYSKFLSTINRRRCAIFINSLVLSEFANRCLRLDYDLWKKLPVNLGKDFKRDYSLTNQYFDTVIGIKSAISQIMHFAIKGNDNFNSIDFNCVLANFGKVDFNDSYYVQLCIERNWKFVTEDHAIRNLPSSVTIVTTR